MISSNFIVTIYYKLVQSQKNKINNFLKDNFENLDNYDFLNNTIIILYFEDIQNYEDIIGCICLLDNFYLKEKLLSCNVSFNNYYFTNSHGCFIYNLCVHKDHRNKKIGYNLINYTILKMKEINIDYLHVHADNDISYNLFLKNGFIDEKSEDKKLLYKYI
jgi:ribosomal protein S18 acetylase RimI-like enzyme